ncbi:MAG: hypothetical protein Q4B02_06140 [Propionibacteriaceae bacterium]|nr:hypothetical protein [Propionibacteriaceae bacterium]
MVRFNTDPLMAPLTPQELRVLKQRRRSGEFGYTKVSTIAVTAIFFMVFFILFIFVGSNVARVFISDMSITQRFQPRFELILIPAAFVGVFAIVALVFIKAGLANFRKRRNWALLARFADVNGLRFALQSANPRYPGLLFDMGHSRASVNHLYSPTGVLVDVGGYEYTTGSGKNSTTHHWNFAAFRLPKPVPHLLLDAKANNSWGFTNLPAVFASSQRVSLGAPFDDHYQLYTPSGYGHDAFYLLPPNVLDALLRASASYDIEMVDQWLFCYTQSPQDLTDPATWRLLEMIAGGVLGALNPVVSRYSDQHARQQPAGGPYGPGVPAQVASQGLRLKRGINLISLIGIAGFVVYLLVRALLRM